MNKWKISFWSCLTILIFVTGFLVFEIIDQGITLTYQKESFKNTENDLNELIKLINRTELEKSEIKNELKNHFLYEYMDFKSDSISLERIILIFDNDTLVKIENQW